MRRKLFFSFFVVSGFLLGSVLSSSAPQALADDGASVAHTEIRIARTSPVETIAGLQPIETPPPTPQETIAPPPSGDPSTQPCPGLEAMHIYPVRVYDRERDIFTCPSEGSDLIFVDPEAGNDLYAGTFTHPYQSITKAKTRLQNGMPHWVLLKRGTTMSFSGFQQGGWKSGRSKLEPLVLTAYGPPEHGRPHLSATAPGNAIAVTGQLRNFTISGLRVSSTPGFGGAGFQGRWYIGAAMAGGLHAGVHPLLPPETYIDLEVNTVIEDSSFTYLKDIIELQGLKDKYQWNEFRQEDYPQLMADYSVNGRLFIYCSTVEDDPQDPNFVLDRALACNRDMDFDPDGSHRLCREDSDEPCTNIVTIYPRVYNVLVAGNDISHSTNSPSGGHSQGIYASAIYDLAIRGNSIDHNGWYLDREGALPNSRGATIFDHNIYLQTDSGPAVLRDNIITRGSSHGAQMRSGGIAEDNLFARNPLGMFVGGLAEGNFKYHPSIVRKNVFSEGLDITSTLDRGFSVDSNAAYFSLIERNLISNLHPSSGGHNNFGPRVVCVNTANRPCTVVVQDNTVINWSRADGTGTSAGLVILDDGISHSAFDTITFADNTIIESRAPGRRMVDLTQGSTIFAPHLLFTSNRYVTEGIAGQGLFLNLANLLTGSQWLTSKEPNARLLESHPVPDACRTVASYQYVVIEGHELSSACSVMHDDERFEAFMTEARRRTNRFLKDPQYSARAVNAWLAEGAGIDWD